MLGNAKNQTKKHLKLKLQLINSETLLKVFSSTQLHHSWHRQHILQYHFENQAWQYFLLK